MWQTKFYTHEKQQAKRNLYDAGKAAPNAVVGQVAGHSGWGLWFCWVSSIDLAVTASFPLFLLWIPDTRFGAKNYLWLYEKKLTAEGQYIISHVVLVTGFKIRYIVTNTGYFLRFRNTGEQGNLKNRVVGYFCHVSVVELPCMGHFPLYNIGLGR